MVKWKVDNADIHYRTFARKMASTRLSRLSSSEPLLILPENPKRPKK